MQDGEKKTRRQREAEKKELHDFLFDVESSAKKILKGHTKKKQAETARHRVLAEKEARRRSKKKAEKPRGIIDEEDLNEKLESQAYGPESEGVGVSESDLVTEIPLLAQPRSKEGVRKNHRFETKLPDVVGTKGSLGGNRHTQSLPVLTTLKHRKQHNAAKAIIERVKTKLEASPLAWTPESLLAKREGLSNAAAFNDRAAAQESATRKFQTQKPKLVKTLQQGTHKPVQIAGHFAPGTVPPRAEHAVPRRLAISQWLNPNKKTSLESGLSNFALKALDANNELQGPTNWSSVDLRLKYRDESQRTSAWQASIENEQEAERLRIEQQVFIPVITVTQHPVHLDFIEVLAAVNMEAVKRARARTRLKKFSYNLPIIWSVNRPEEPEKLLIKDLENQREGQQESEEGSIEETNGNNSASSAREPRCSQGQSYPPKFCGVNGVENRRDRLAHESPDCQVQSVTAERAMQGADRIIKQMRESSTSSTTNKSGSDAVRAKIRRVSMARDLRNRSSVSNGSIFLENCKKRRKREWSLYGAAVYRMILSVGAEGLLNVQSNGVDEIGKKVQEQEERRNAAPKTQDDNQETRENIIISVFRDDRTDIDVLGQDDYNSDDSEDSSGESDTADQGRFSNESNRNVGGNSRKKAPEAWTVVAYSTYDSTEYEMSITDARVRALFDQRRISHRLEFEQASKQYNDRVALQEHLQQMASEVALGERRALWWSIVTFAAKTAHYGDLAKPDDQFADLAGYSEEEARSSIQEVDKKIKENSTAAHRATIVHRQCVRVPVYVAKQRTKEHVNCQVIAAVATAGAQDDPNTTCVVLHLKRTSDLESFACAFSVAALQKWIETTVLDEDGFSVDSPPNQAKWWLLNSEWKTELFKAFFRRLCFEQDSIITVETESVSVQLRPFVAGMPTAQAAAQYQVMRTCIEEAMAQYALDGLIENIEAPEKFHELSETELLQHVLAAPKASGGLGIAACVWDVRALRTAEQQRQLALRLKQQDSAYGLDAIGEAPCMALQVCSRGPKDRNYIGAPPPSTTVFGHYGFVPALFTRDADISSTNSVTVVVCYALEHALLAPVMLGFNTDSAVATRAPEFLDLPRLNPVAVAPFVAKRVISKLDFRESCTIVILNSSATEEDLGLASKVYAKAKSDVTNLRKHTRQTQFSQSDINGGHRRQEPEITPLFFRVRMDALLEELCVPDPSIFGTVFGITEQAATTNAPDTWPHRYTWHSDLEIMELLTRKRAARDFAYVSAKTATVGPNEPNAYRSDMVVEMCQSVHKVPFALQVKMQAELELRLENEERDAVLRKRLEAARVSKAQSEEQRALLEQELNDKRLQRERALRGKTADRNGLGARTEEWAERQNDPSTKRLGRWGSWQAYLFLDHQAKEIVMRAAQQVELDQLARIAAGERPLSRKKIMEEAFELAVKEGTLFYHNEIEDVYQWDQPEGWYGVATVPEPVVESSESEKAQQLEKSHAQELQDVHVLRGDKSGLVEGDVSLNNEYDEQAMRSKKDKEIAAVRQSNAKAALVAAKDVEHSRRLRFVEENLRRWLDTKASAMGESGACDLRAPFREMDDDKTGLLSYEEFRIGLANNEIDLPVDDQDTLIKHLDKDKNNMVDYIEFVHLMIYTHPDSREQWIEKCMDTPELGPNTWSKMQEVDTRVSVVALYEEYKNNVSGQHYYFHLESGTYQWVMPDTFAVKSRQERDAEELRQAQVAASLAARAAAESAELAERASERSVGRIVEHLATSSEFVQFIASELGLKEFMLAKEREDAALKRQETATLVPALRLQKQEEDDESIVSLDENECDDTSEDDDEADLPPSVESAASKHVNTENAITKPGQDWRKLKPGRLKEGFITKASRPNTRGADLTIFSHNHNRASLVGVVDPADVSHIPFEDFPAVEIKFISDVMEDTLVASNMTKEQLLDKSEEEEMIEMVQEAFLAVRNQRYEKVVELLDLGVKHTEQDENGNTLLIIAAQQNAKRIVKFLLRRGADINTQNLQGNTALHFCFTYSFTDLGEYLIAKGAADNILNAKGFSPYEGIDPSAD